MIMRLERKQPFVSQMENIMAINAFKKPCDLGS